MAIQEEPITIEGIEAVQTELEHLIKVEREALKKIIQEARELGDLKENAEYHAAKEKQSLLEGRISLLQGVVAQGRVIDVKGLSSERIIFGAIVTLTDVEKDQTVTYQVVGEHESDIKNGKVSYKSPLGKAMLGKEEGDTVIVKAPKGDVEYEVDSFKFN